MTVILCNKSYVLGVVIYKLRFFCFVVTQIKQIQNAFVLCNLFITV